MSARKSRGYTLLEAMISLFILTTLSIVIFTFQGLAMESKAKEKDIMHGVFLVESMKNMILCNLYYDDLKSTFVDKVLFINKGNVENGSIYTNNILDLVQGYSEGDYPLMLIEGYEEIESQAIRIKITYKYSVGEEMSNVFYKGNYKKN